MRGENLKMDCVTTSCTRSVTSRRVMHPKLFLVACTGHSASSAGVGRRRMRLREPAGA